MSDGCECKRCGAIFKTDLYVPDEDWERIRGGCNLLCPSCIVSALESQDGFGAYRLTPVDQLAAKDREIAELREACAAVERERDAAQAAWVSSITERDEARECVKRLYPALHAATTDAGRWAQLEWIEALAATPEHLRGAS